ncbi:hypothetical protein MC7420_605 [Coleofasciculus chthonoplastes PCC 7420]|uniref:Uncharacterized protein n=1 Tax=Coleofasciculus chthonoplastes PCC 7420 TaxID=118168 RepID=B4VL94_9CYAN|nr:hypothetical protein MC7420_605 [Coleofasciculus chthonoplastes PCC 7420]
MEGFKTVTAKLNANGRYQNLHPATKCYTREHQPVPQTLDKKSNSRLNSSLQNVSSLALYSVAAFAVPGFFHPAWATSSVKTTYQPDIAVPTPIEPSETQAGSSVTSTTSAQAVASPESIIVQEFTPESKVEGSGSTIEEDRIKLEFSGESELTLPTLDASELEIASPELERPDQIVPTVVSARQTGTNRQSRVDEYTQDDTDVNTFAIDRENHADKEDKENRQPVALNPKKPCSATQQTMLAQAPNQRTQPSPCREVNRLQEELRSLEDIDIQSQLRASPALSIVIPTAYGAHRNTGFVSATYQERTRYSDVDDGALGIGIGLGDAEKSVGVELSYALASFGSSRDFGSGGFNAKVHRRLPQGWAVAAGWNGLINLGDDNDFENSVYGVVSKIIRTREDINQPFSRVAITAGIGNGQFRTEEAVEDDNGTINVFGNVAVRVAEPVSLIAEWTGQDLGVGVSIAPFKNIPLVITPALRDIAGAGDGARFVLGAGFAFKF